IPQTRKRTASFWEEEENEKPYKRTEISTDDEPESNYADDIGSPNSALPSPISDTEQEWPLEDMRETFDALPSPVQKYALFQLLKRSHRNTLKATKDTILHHLRKDLLLSLPLSIAHHILSFVDVPSLCRATAVNSSWKDLIDNAHKAWEFKLVENNFTPTPRELTDSSPTPYKNMVRRHTIMRRNWRLNKHRKLLLEGHEDDLITCLQFDEDKVITGSDDHRIHMYDVNTGQLKNVMEGHEGGVWALEYVDNTLVTGSIDRTVRVWDIERGLCRFVLRGHTSTVRCLKIVMPSIIDGQLQPSEPLIISGSRDMTIRVWKLPDLNDLPLPLIDLVEDDFISRKYLKFTLKEHESSVRDIAVHGNTLVSGGYDNTVIVWDLATGESRHLLKGHTMKVYCVAIDPKRRHCISGSLDSSVRIWGLDDGECKFVLQGHAILVGLIGLADDFLVSAAADYTLRTWDPSTGDRHCILAGHRGPITAFQHDQHKIVSGSEGAVKMWDTKTGELLHDLIQDVTSVWRICFNERRCISAVKSHSQNSTQLVVLDYGFHDLEDELL
ncbi:SCF ubiquitin ligase complex subunit cdc4, partial [Rhizopus stolonifer]